MGMDEAQLAAHMRASFEASLPQRLSRSRRVKIQHVIPSHWFSAAASECQSMFVAGHFYGAISIAQAYVESLSRFLYETYRIRGNANDPQKRWDRLLAETIVGTPARDAAVSVLSDRHDFHHLNKEVEQEYQQLENRAKDCVNLLYMIEADVFAHSFHEGSIVPKHPKHWPSGKRSLTLAYIRQKW
jgi:hypothetical protein